ncbi:hypothetical protein OG413_27060 [Streptomyces sp. NBC_01433]|uniref:hypothetical protein n=1 Tax=Streptomyces sp. NBC_01433 TaxID=2903864 RepID=UPI002255CDDB|nr:hypothetical protein [Streptomyces sp. NBC_01433]MCX4678926.1 hypothetical protein [Streptomyces sp. NBC_01433]
MHVMRYEITLPADWELVHFTLRERAGPKAVGDHDDVLHLSAPEPERPGRGR